MLIYTHIDLHDYEIQNMKVHVSNTAPSAQKGQIYLDSTVNILKWHDGTIWRSLPTDYLSIGDNVSQLVNDANYLTSYTETDPVFLSHVAHGIGSIDITNWNNAYSWGDHSLAGYITTFSETDTLDSVTLRNPVTNNDITVGGLIVQGNLVVSGTTTTINTEEILLADNIITLNSNAVGAPSENAGLLIERGTSTNRGFRWNEGSNVWEIQRDDNIYYEIEVVDPTGKIYKETITDSATVNHGFNLRDIQVQMYDTVTFEVYQADWTSSTVNSIVVTFYETPVNPIRVLITKIV